MRAQAAREDRARAQARTSGTPYDSGSEVGGSSDAGKKVELKSGYALPHDEDVGAVIVGFDREINYHKIQYAQLCINENPGCQFIATNLDAVTHLTDAQETQVK